MGLDVRSIYLMSVLVALSLACITLFFGHKDEQNRVIRDWGASTLMIAVGLGLLMTQGHVTYLVSQLLADTLLIAGATLAYRSMRVYRAESTRDVAGWIVVAVVSGTLAFGDPGIASPSVRSVMVSAVLAVLMGRIAWAIGYRPLPVAVTAQRFTAVTYLLFGLVFALRSVNTLLRSPGGFSLMGASLVDVSMIAGNTMLWVSATLGVMWMVIGRQQAELVRLATRDPLTEALNRNAMGEEFERETYRASRARGQFAVAMLDIDHFKHFNDAYGHLTGDDVLKSLVATMRRTVRKNDLIGRYGGEEFLILMPEADLRVALQVVERVRSGIAAIGYRVKETPVLLTVSAGIAVYPDHGTGWDMLVGGADTALYQAKTDGRNRVSVATVVTDAKPAAA